LTSISDMSGPPVELGPPARVAAAGAGITKRPEPAAAAGDEDVNLELEVPAFLRRSEG
jgi:hypothetical protein